MAAIDTDEYDLRNSPTAKAARAPAAPAAPTGYRPHGTYMTPQARKALAEQYPTGFDGSQQRAVPNATAQPRNANNTTAPRRSALPVSDGLERAEGSGTAVDRSARNQRVGSQQGVPTRSVTGAPGVVRMDVPGLSPLYTNVPEDPWNTARTGRGGTTRGGTVSGGPGSGLGVDPQVQAINDRWMESRRREKVDNDMRRLLDSPSRSTRQAAINYFSGQQQSEAGIEQQRAKGTADLQAKMAELRAKAPADALAAQKTEAEIANLTSQMLDRQGYEWTPFVEPDISMSPAQVQEENARISQERLLLQRYLSENPVESLFGPKPPDAPEEQWKALTEAASRNLNPKGVFRMAEGGVVPPVGGAMDATVPTPQNPAQQQYAMYAANALQNQVQPLPFDQFTELMERTRSSMTQTPTVAMAGGGVVPGQEDVSGRQVLDANPAAPTDSIPAVIDGQQPAALDSGEFVIPKDVVMYHGLARLKKLIAEARQAEEA